MRFLSETVTLSPECTTSAKITALPQGVLLPQFLDRCLPLLLATCKAHTMHTVKVNLSSFSELMLCECTRSLLCNCSPLYFFDSYSNVLPPPLSFPLLIPPCSSSRICNVCLLFGAPGSISTFLFILSVPPPPCESSPNPHRLAGIALMSPTNSSWFLVSWALREKTSKIVRSCQSWIFFSLFAFRTKSGVAVKFLQIHQTQPRNACAAAR